LPLGKQGDGVIDLYDLMGFSDTVDVLEKKKCGHVPMVASVYTTVNTLSLDMYIHPRIIQAMPHISIRVTEEEKEQYRQLVEREGRPLTEIIKRYLNRIVRSSSKSYENV
jgi:hypothetical protein